MTAFETLDLSLKKREAHWGAKGPEARGEGARLKDASLFLAKKRFENNLQDLFMIIK